MRGDKPVCDISLQRLIHHGIQVMFWVQGEPHRVPSRGALLELCVGVSLLDSLYLSTLLVQPLTLRLAEEPAWH